MTNTDEVVLGYLKKRGYKQAEAAFRNDAKITGAPSTSSLPAAKIDQMIFESMAVDFDTAGDQPMLFSSSADAQPKQLEDSFRRFKAFVEDSLDLYKPELQAARYPMFVHVFLDLVARGFSEEAHRFFEMHKMDYIDQYPADLQQLGTVTEPHHVLENTMAQTFRENKYTILMSSYAFDLLLSFLQDNKMMTMLKFVNQYLNIKVYSTKSLQKLKEEQEQTSVGITGHTSREIRSMNQQDVYLGPTGYDNAFLELLEKKVKLEDTRNEIDLKKQQPESLHSTFTEYKREKQRGQQPPAEEAVPLPPKLNRDVTMELQRLADIRNRVKISAQHQPSAIAYTFHNTYDSLNALTLSEDGRICAGGFAESYIKVWSLSDENLRSLKATTELSVMDFENVHDEDAGREPRGDPFKRLVGHSGPVYGVAFSPDQRYLLSGSQDGTARLWSMDTYSNLVAYRGHNYPIWDVDFGPQGYYFATASHDRTARLWSCEHIYPLRIFASHLSDVDSVKFHPNSNYLFTGSSDKTVRMWDIHRGRCVRVFTGAHPTNTSSILSLAVSPDGLTMASGGDDGSVVVWDIGQAKPLKRFGALPAELRATGGGGSSGGLLKSGHIGAVYSLDFSADSSILASGGADCTVRVWNVKRSDSVGTDGAGDSGNDGAGGSGLIATGTGTDGDSVADSVVSLFRTKRTPIYRVRFTPRNLLLTAGPFTPYSTANAAAAANM